MSTSDEERRFGRDIALPDDPDGEVPVTPTGDMATIAGRPNVHGALRRRELTSPGALLHRPAFGAGLVDQVEQAASPSRRSAIANDTRRQLLQDRRVAEARVQVELGVPGNPRAPDAITVRTDVRLHGDESAEQLTTYVE